MSKSALNSAPRTFSRSESRRSPAARAGRDDTGRATVAPLGGRDELSWQHWGQRRAGLCHLAQVQRQYELLASQLPVTVHVRQGPGDGAYTANASHMMIKITQYNCSFQVYSNMTQEQGCLCYETEGI